MRGLVLSLIFAVSLVGVIVVGPVIATAPAGDRAAIWLTEAAVPMVLGGGLFLAISKGGRKSLSVATVVGVVVAVMIIGAMHLGRR